MLVASPTDRDSLFALYDWKASERRRMHAGRKLDMYHDRFVPLVRRLIAERVDDDTAHLVQRYASATNNLARTVVDTVAMGYSKGCRRTLRDASPELAKAWAEVVAETGWDRRCAQVSHYAFWLGPVFVLPSVDARLKVGLDVVTPDRSDCMRSGPEYIHDLVWQRPDDSVFVRVDEQAWRYYDPKGKPLAAVPPVEHGFGYVPAAIFRAASWDSGWWLESEHQGLYEATLDVAFKTAIMQWARKVQANKLLVLKGMIENIPPGQSPAQPGGVLYLRGRAADIEADILDRTVPVADFLTEIAALINAAVSRYSIPATEVTFEQNTNQWGALSISVRKEKLGALRDAQVPWLREGERQMWCLVADAVRASRLHKHANALPPGSEIADMLELSFPDYIDTAEALKRHELFEKRVRHGLENPINLLLEQTPELSPAEAEEIVMTNLKKWGERQETAITHGLSTDPAKGAQTLQQVQGAIGGSTRADNALNENNTP